MQCEWNQQLHQIKKERHGWIEDLLKCATMFLFLISVELQSVRVAKMRPLKWLKNSAFTSKLSGKFPEHVICTTYFYVDPIQRPYKIYTSITQFLLKTSSKILFVYSYYLICRKPFLSRVCGYRIQNVHDKKMYLG